MHIVRLGVEKVILAVRNVKQVRSCSKRGSKESRDGSNVAGTEQWDIQESVKQFAKLA